MSGRTAIVGAGLAGVVCALDLSASREVVLFERELHPGGRLAACRGGGFEFDCGAPYFLATAPEFRERLRDWLAEELLARWECWAVELDHGNMLTRDPGAARYVGVPSMAALAGKLAALMELKIGVDVTQLSRDADGWWLIDAMQQRHGPFAEVVCATPPAEAAQLLEAHAPALAQRAQAVRYRGLEIKLRPSSGVEVRAAYRVRPTIAPLEAVNAVGSYNFPLGDLVEGEEPALLLELIVPARQPGVYRLAQALLACDDPAGGPAGLKTRADVVVEYTPDPAQAATITGPRGWPDWRPRSR
ncbi:MAG: NAD(P)-binding protein [Acidihalobacter sp.]